MSDYIPPIPAMVMRIEPTDVSIAQSADPHAAPGIAHGPWRRSRRSGAPRWPGTRRHGPAQDPGTYPPLRTAVSARPTAHPWASRSTARARLITRPPYGGPGCCAEGQCLASPVPEPADCPELARRHGLVVGVAAGNRLALAGVPEGTGRANRIQGPDVRPVVVGEAAAGRRSVAAQLVPGASRSRGIADHTLVCSTVGDR
jgi:hypothetical protein